MVRFFMVITLVFGCWGASISAQSTPEVVYLQIEAQPDFEQALQRAEFFAQTLPDVSGFALPGGWYAIAIGPYTRSDAEQVLSSYRAQGLIPRDSYIALTRTFGQQYWPQDGDLLDEQILTLDAPLAIEEDNSLVIADAQTTVSAQDEETPAQARRSERLLSPQERQDLQTALKWAGFYNAAIDGAFGRGTRNSMSDWQIANGYEPTGILTTAQRAALMGQYNAILDGLGMQTVRDDAAGIEIALPTSIIAFDRYEAPFAQYNASTDFQARVLLISQEGNRATLQSLYEIMQTLEIVPLEGPRSISRNRFSLVGRNGKTVSETRAELSGGQIKGFTLVWPTGDEARRKRVIAELDNSFQRLSTVLDPNAGAGNGEQIDLISGLQIRKPLLSQSGFFVDQAGAVVTSADAVQSCTRITLDELYDATLSSIDADRGIAILKPKEVLAPPAIARFSTASPRLQSQVAVAGYSFEGQLPSPSVTFGTFSDIKGLRGEADLNRLSVESLPGDIGGPVFDDNGNVFGMLLPLPQTGRTLPQEVRFALTGEAIAGVLAQAGLSASAALETASLAPEDITERGVGMTVLVSCWE